MARWLLVTVMGIVAALALLVDHKVLGPYCVEDGPVENAQALFYLLAGILFCIGAWRQGWHGLLYLGFGLLFIMAGGEEISWGQRIFGVATPEAFEARNVQGEMNVHNLKGIHGIVRALGLLIVLGTCLVIPVADRLIPAAKRLLARLHMPVFPIWCSPVVIVSIAMMLVAKAMRGRGEKGDFQIDEVAELLMAASFFIFAVVSLRALRHRTGGPWQDATAFIFAVVSLRALRRSRETPPRDSP
jgi:hypothetical protein